MFMRKAIGFLSRKRFKLPPSTSTCTTTSSSKIPPITSNRSFSSLYSSQFSTSGKHEKGIAFWTLLYGQAAIILGMNANLALAEEAPVELGTGNEINESGFVLRRIEDGSVISNKHTSKWLIFTNMAKELHQQGKVEEAERYLLLALQEAKQGFGERDPHVASACNNLAELYRVRKEFDKADPLYSKAVNILEESYGPDDIRLSVAFDNLGQFYFVQKKLEDARLSYERALKIKRRVLGHAHIECAHTMYHLGRVMHLQGNEKDSEALIQNSIRILEEAGQEDSVTCLRRLRYISQIYWKSNRHSETESIQRKILQIIELSKGWNSLDTVNAAEELALTLQLTGSLKEAQELLEQCLNVRKTMLHEDHIQIGANMLRMARVAMLNANGLMKANFSEASAEFDKAKTLLDNSIRIANKVLDSLKEKRCKMKNSSKSKRSGKDEHAALFILLQSFIALGLLEITKQESQVPREEYPHQVDAEHAFRQCTTAYKEAARSGTPMSICNSPDIKEEYLACLKHLVNLLKTSSSNTQEESKSTLEELEDEINSIEAVLKENRE